MGNALLTMGKKAVLTIIIAGFCSGLTVYYAAEHPAYAELAHMSATK
jgi:hypothetical protein